MNAAFHDQMPFLPEHGSKIVVCTSMINNTFKVLNNNIEKFLAGFKDFDTRGGYLNTLYFRKIMF